MGEDRDAEILPPRKKEERSFGRLSLTESLSMSCPVCCNVCHPTECSITCAPTKQPGATKDREMFNEMIINVTEGRFSFSSPSYLRSSLSRVWLGSRRI